MTGVSECSQQRGNLKDNGYIPDTAQASCPIANGKSKYSGLIYAPLLA
ncbi:MULTISPECIES: hypothetical protein [Photorhabdus]|nr:hypothetical protein [Photorhabdus asymbiotica]